MIVHVREFLGVVALVTVVPGPDTALVVRNAVSRGRAAGLLTAIGCTLGLTVWALAAALGVATLLRLSASLVTVVRLAGGVYLLVLGARCLRSGWRAAFASRPPVANGTAGADRAAVRESEPARVPARDLRDALGRGGVGRHHAGALAEGLLADLLNPKAAAFFTAFLPQFVAPGDAVRGAITLGLIAAAAALLGLSLYALAAARAGALLRQRWPSALLDAATGIGLLVLGAAVARRGSAVAHAQLRGLAP